MGVKIGNILMNTTMKKILSIAIVAVALFSLASCQKMDCVNNDSEKAVRVITGEFFNNETKTTLGTNDQPLWSVGDKIRVLNGTTYQDITLTSSNIDSEDASKITFTTTLEGMLYAVYPASATAMTSCSGNITFTIPAVQDGTFGSANICVASGDGPTGKSIYFSNATAVVEMTVASGVVYANLTAANEIAGEMTVALAEKGVISSTTTTSLSSNYIFVSSTPSDSKFYLTVAPVETGAITINCNTTSKSGSEGRSAKTLAMNKIYAMNLSSMTIETEDLTGQHGVLNGQEYVIIKGSDGKYLKWATQNLAVTTSGKAKWESTNYVIGDYFQWAAYDGYVSGTKPENLVIYSSFTNTCAGGSSNSFTFKDSKQFDQASAPYYYSASSYTKYNFDDGKIVLDQSDDVANIVLGSTWRMPTGGDDGEFKALYNATKWTWDDTDKGYYVTKSGEPLASNKSNALLFFPTAGIGSGQNLSNAGGYGIYWSSTLFLYLDYALTAYNLRIGSSEVAPVNLNNRHFGYSVRPVSN